MFRSRMQFSAKAVFDFSNPAKYVTATSFTEKPVGFLNGSFVEGISGSTISVEDPCTNVTIGAIPNMGRAETDQAISYASEAFKSWSQVMPRERAVILHRWSRLMEEYKETLGTILSRESGKVIAEGVGEALYSQRFVEWYAGEAERISGDIIGGPRPNVRTTVIKQPIGVVGVITPWNFPSSMITRAVAGALAAGCTVVLKPSELTPFSALALAQVATEAGVPPGVFNIVTGDAAPISDALLESFDVRKISFTGSTRVGKLLYERSAATMKKLGLELGGNAPFIVFDDADLDRAADQLVGAKFRNAGQTCISCNRVFVQESVHDAFLSKLVERVKALKVGNSFDKSSKVGSMINEQSVERMVAVVADAQKKGATIAAGGKRVDGPGYFFEPTIIANANHETMDCCQNELFGPVAPVLKFKTEEEVLKLANSTRAGLASYIFTKDYGRQVRVSEGLRFGMVGVNDSAISSPCAPFGGVKESGLGRDGSKYGIDAFVEIKYVLQSSL